VHEAGGLGKRVRVATRSGSQHTPYLVAAPYLVQVAENWVRIVLKEETFLHSQLPCLPLEALLKAPVLVFSDVISLERN
jgi:hypothetical protein